MSDLERYQKEVKSVIVTVTDEDGVAVDITSSTLEFTVKTQADDDATDSTAIISKTVFVTSGTSGQATIPISESDTNITPKTYFYDLWRVKPDGSQYVIKRGKFIVKKTETNRV